MKTPPKHSKRPAEPDDLINLEESVVELVKNEKGEYEIHQPKPGHMPQYVLDNLKKLYGQKKAEAQKMVEKKRSESEIKKITEDLSNVDLDWLKIFKMVFVFFNCLFNEMVWNQDL